MKAKGFVSDMDGVVADTEELWLEGTKKFLGAFGAAISREEYGVLIGAAENDDARFLKDKYGLSLNEEQIVAKRRKAVLEAMNVAIPPADGYLELLERLRANGVKASLVSMSPREIIDAILSATGLGGRFIATVSAREAGSKRDAYLAAVRRMAIRPSECFALEDSPGGARAAKEAGLYCVAIPNAFLKNADFSFVDEVHRSIREFLANGRVLETLAHP